MILILINLVIPFKLSYDLTVIAFQKNRKSKNPNHYQANYMNLKCDFSSSI